MPRKALTDQHLKFLQTYLANGGNATDAYAQAFPNCKNRVSAGSLGARMLKRPQIASRLAQMRAATERKADTLVDRAISHHIATKGRIMDEQARMGLSNMRDFVRIQDDGSPVLDFGKLSEDQWAAVKSITVEEFTDGKGDDARQVRKVRFELYDKSKSLMDLARLKGLVVDKKQITVQRLEDLSDEQLQQLYRDAVDITATPVPIESEGAMTPLPAPEKPPEDT